MITPSGSAQIAVPLRAAVIGCGAIGSRRSEGKQIAGVLSHAEAYVTCPQTELVALVDSDERALERAGRLWGVQRLYRDVGGLVNDDAPPHITSVCTPDSTHSAIVRQLVEAGVPAILCEKPLATDASVAIAVAELARQRSAVLAVNYSRRYDPMHRSVRARLRAGGIGAVRHITGWYTKGIIHNGTHLLDTLRFFCGEIIEVHGFNPKPGLGSDLSPDAIVWFAGGILAFIHGCDARDFTIFEIDLLGSTGRVRLVDHGHAVEVFAVGPSHYYPEDRELARVPFGPAVGLRDALLHAVEDTVHALRTGGPPGCTAHDAIRALQIAQEITWQATQSGAGHPETMRRG